MRPTLPCSSWLRLAALCAALAALAPSAFAQPGVPDPARPVTARPLEFEFLGPAGGGRIASITGVPGDTAVWYVGSASGGVWKSTDGGHRFVPVFDSMDVQAIGAVAVAPSKPAIVWAGTGEAWAIRDADIIGDGVYRSDDAGKTWRNMGLRETGRIARILVHPSNPNVVYVCALGRTTAPQEERGVYRTTDGGATWTRVLFVDPNTGCSSLAMDAKNPKVLLAGMWQVEMHPWAMFSGGPSSGLWITHDGGSSWTQVQDPGLPRPPVGKIGVAIAPTNSNRMYALIQTADQGSLWRSDNAGRSWKMVSWARALIGRGGYYMHLAVSSGNPDEVLVANSGFWRSTDGGRTFRQVQWGGDNHDIWMDPRNPDHFGLTNDAGARVTTTHGKSWNNISLPNAQMYHVAVDHQLPYWVYGNRQDDGTMRGSSAAPE
ncbi:MAG TPA: glycosyl hydrolase, partial [Gemmatimonadaceae bacterium]|nr:glycosyl hydrolase [Gemmatimonadaceae bacterium]